MKALAAAREALHRRERAEQTGAERVNVSAEPSMWLSPLPVPLKLSMLQA